MVHASGFRPAVGYSPDGRGGHGAGRLLAVGYSPDGGGSQARPWQGPYREQASGSSSTVVGWRLRSLTGHHVRVCVCSSQLRRGAAQHCAVSATAAPQQCSTSAVQRLCSAGTCVSQTIVVEKKHATHRKPTRKVHLTKPETGFNRGCKLNQQHTQLFCWCPPQLIRGDSQYSHHVTQQPSITLQVG